MKRSIVILILFFLVIPVQVSAQRSVVEGPSGLTPQALQTLNLDVLDEDPVSPRGAFVRSLVFPGWGQMASGAPTRGAFFVGAQGGSYWMLGRTLLRQRQAIRFRDRAEEDVRRELTHLGIQSPDSLRLLARQDARVVQRDSLVSMRGDQVEDWVALSIFLAFLSATDALVSSHMARFPEPLGMSPSAIRRADGGWEVRVDLPWP